MIEKTKLGCTTSCTRLLLPYFKKVTFYIQVQLTELVGGGGERRATCRTAAAAAAAKQMQQGQDDEGSCAGD